MDISPSRSSQESRLSTLSSTLPSSCSPSLSSSFSSPRPPSSALSVRSEDSSVSESGFDVCPYLDRLDPCVTALLSHFDRVNQITEDIHNLEVKLEEAQSRRRKELRSNREKVAKRCRESTTRPVEEDDGGRTEELNHRKTGLLHTQPHESISSSSSYTPSTLHPICIFPHTPRSYSESESETRLCGLNPVGPPSVERFLGRRAWHSGSSYSADAAQRGFQFSGGTVLHGNTGEHLTLTNARPRSEEGIRRRVSDGVPVKRKAWISEGPETEQDDR